VAIYQDITASKAAEQALREARDELEQRVRERTAQLDETVATLQEEVAKGRSPEPVAAAERNPAKRSSTISR